MDKVKIDRMANLLNDIATKGYSLISFDDWNSIKIYFNLYKIDIKSWVGNSNIAEIKIEE